MSTAVPLISKAVISLPVVANMVLALEVVKMPVATILRLKVEPSVPLVVKALLV